MGEQVVDVPPKLSARARVFATGQGRKTDATDAHSVALAGTRMAGLRPKNLVTDGLTIYRNVRVKVRTGTRDRSRRRRSTVCDW
jgi:hypothetical protein